MNRFLVMDEKDHGFGHVREIPHTRTGATTLQIEFPKWYASNEVGKIKNWLVKLNRTLLEQGQKLIVSRAGNVITIHIIPFVRKAHLQVETRLVRLADYVDADGKVVQGKIVRAHVGFNWVQIDNKWVQLQVILPKVKQPKAPQFSKVTNSIKSMILEAIEKQTNKPPKIEKIKEAITELVTRKTDEQLITEHNPKPELFTIAQTPAPEFAEPTAEVKAA